MSEIVALAWAPGPDDEGLFGLDAAYRALGARLLDERLTVLQERVYARGPAVDRLARIRATTPGIQEDVPVTLLTNEAPSSTSGVQILAVRPAVGESISTVRTRWGAGRLWESGTSRALFGAVSVPAGGPGVAGLFERCAELVSAQELSLRDVARTWLYVADLLPTYARLNAVRDAAFEAAGLKTAGGWAEAPPASTGIQGVAADGAPCFAELLALRGLRQERPFTPVRPPLQGEAWEYGSSFSRGMTIDFGESRRLVTISGTASIDRSGRSLHHDDPDAQIAETLRNIEGLLDAAGVADAGAGLWTVYVKDRATLEAWQRTRDPRVPATAAIIQADVCRPELLFEVEVTVPLSPT